MTATLRIMSRFLFVLTVFVLGACAEGDARTKRITVGMSRDSAVAIMQETDGVPSMGGAASNTNIWRVAQYLNSGKMIQVIYYSGDNEHWAPSDTVPEKRVVPIVVVDGKVVAVGQAAYQKTAAQYSLPKVRY